MSDEKVGQLNAAKPKFQDININFNLGKLQSSKLDSNASEENLVVL